MPMDQPSRYGYTKSANSQNRAINEISFRLQPGPFGKDAKYGAINFMGQYEYLSANPWYVATGAPKNAHDNTILLQPALYPARLPRLPWASSVALLSRNKDWTQ